MDTSNNFPPSPREMYKLLHAHQNKGDAVMLQQPRGPTIRRAQPLLPERKPQRQLGKGANKVMAPTITATLLRQHNYDGRNHHGFQSVQSSLEGPNVCRNNNKPLSYSAGFSRKQNVNNGSNDSLIKADRDKCFHSGAGHTMSEKTVNKCDFRKLIPTGNPNLEAPYNLGVVHKRSRSSERVAPVSSILPIGQQGDHPTGAFHAVKSLRHSGGDYDYFVKSMTGENRQPTFMPPQMTSVLQLNSGKVQRSLSNRHQSRGNVSVMQQQYKYRHMPLQRQHGLNREQQEMDDVPDTSTAVLLHSLSPKNYYHHAHHHSDSHHYNCNQHYDHSQLSSLHKSLPHPTPRFVTLPIPTVVNGSDLKVKSKQVGSPSQQTSVCHVPYQIRSLSTCSHSATSPPTTSKTAVSCNLRYSLHETAALQRPLSVILTNTGSLTAPQPHQMNLSRPVIQPNNYPLVDFQPIDHPNKNLNMVTWPSFHSHPPAPQLPSPHHSDDRSFAQVCISPPLVSSFSQASSAKMNATRASVAQPGATQQRITSSENSEITNQLIQIKLTQVPEKITLPTLEDFDDLPPPPPPEELLCNDLANLTFTSSSPLLTRTSVPSHPHHRCLPPVAGEVDSLQNYHHKIIHLLQLFEETQVLANLQRLEKEIYATYNPCCGDRRYKGHLASDIFMRMLITAQRLQLNGFLVQHYKDDVFFIPTLAAGCFFFPPGRQLSESVTNMDFEILDDIDLSQSPGLVEINKSTPNWTRDMKKNQEKIEEYVKKILKETEQEAKWKNVTKWKRKILEKEEEDSAAVKTTPETEIGERKPGDKKPTKKPPPAPKKDFSHLKPKGDIVPAALSIDPEELAAMPPWKRELLFKREKVPATFSNEYNPEESTAGGQNSPAG